MMKLLLFHQLQAVDMSENENKNIDLLISDKPLNSNACYSFVQNEQSGGIVTFIGTVRNHTKDRKVIKLEFEAFESMAISEMKKIAIQALGKFDIQKIAIHHRTGSLAIGEIAVIIAIGSAHRKAAFAACEYAIDTLKETVPIWKKEYFEGGEIWIAAHP